MRRALGYQLDRHGRLLLQFIDYLEHARVSTITVDVAVTWARQPVGATPIWWASRLSVIRCFARHLHALDPATEVPPANLLPGHYHRTAPRLYSTAEITDIVHATGLLSAPLQAATFRALCSPTRGDWIGQLRPPLWSVNCEPRKSSMRQSAPGEKPYVSRNAGESSVAAHGSSAHTTRRPCDGRRCTSASNAARISERSR